MRAQGSRADFRLTLCWRKAIRTAGPTYAPKANAGEREEKIAMSPLRRIG
jgi:hypothetical protein